jgi:hypothetical protein
MPPVKVTELGHLLLGTEMSGGEWQMGWIAQMSMDLVGDVTPLPHIKIHLIIENGIVLGNSALVQS